MIEQKRIYKMSFVAGIVLFAAMVSSIGGPLYKLLSKGGMETGWIASLRLLLAVVVMV